MCLVLVWFVCRSCLAPEVVASFQVGSRMLPVELFSLSILVSD